MQVNIKPEHEWMVKEALESGRYETAEDFIAAVINEKHLADAAFADRCIAAADAAVKRGGYKELGPNWKEELKADAVRLSEAG